MKKILRSILALVLAVGVAAALCYVSVSKYSRGRLYDDSSVVPHNHAALVLGTSPNGRNGGAMGLPKCSVNHPGEVGSRFTPTQAHDCCLLSPDGLPTQARGPVGGWAPDFCFRAWSLQSPQAEMGSSGGREGYRGTCRKGSEAAPWGPEACPWLQSRVSPLCLTCFKAPPGPVGPGFLVFPRPSCRNCRWSVLW